MDDAIVSAGVGFVILDPDIVHYGCVGPEERGRRVFRKKLKNSMSHALPPPDPNPAAPTIYYGLRASLQKKANYLEFPKSLTAGFCGLGICGNSDFLSPTVGCKKPESLVLATLEGFLRNVIVWSKSFTYTTVAPLKLDATSKHNVRLFFCGCKGDE